MCQGAAGAPGLLRTRVPDGQPPRFQSHVTILDDPTTPPCVSLATPNPPKATTTICAREKSLVGFFWPLFLKFLSLRSQCRDPVPGSATTGTKACLGLRIQGGRARSSYPSTSTKPSLIKYGQGQIKQFKRINVLKPQGATSSKMASLRQLSHHNK